MQLPAWARPSEKEACDLTLYAAILFHFIVMTACPTLAWADEIFQTIEQGHRLAFGYGVVPWEFRDGIRSWVLPGILGAVMRATEFLGSGSAGYMMGLRVFLSFCSAAPVLATMAWARRDKLPYPWVAGLATAVWFELVFFSSKALTEVFAAYALPVALYYGTVVREEAQRRAGILAGLWWGLAVGFRIHLALAAVVAIVWTCRKDLQRWRPVLLGFFAVICAFGLLDWVTWTYPFQSFFMNFWVNVVRGKAATFGVSPPWEYVASLATVWSWASVLLLGLAWSTFRRAPILAVTALVIFVSHSVIGHKEYRFLAPFLVILVMAASLGLLRLLQQRRTVGVLACGAWLLASADGARRYDWEDLAPRPLVRHGPFPMWSYRDSTIQSFAALSTDASICGIGAVGMGWGWTGGYSYLHRNVPMYEISTQEQLDRYTPFLNSMVAPGANGPKLGPFSRSTCWGELCFYQRPGPCEPPGEYTINKWLKDTSM